VKHTEEPDAEKDTCPVLRGTGRQLVKLGAPRLLDHVSGDSTSNKYGSIREVRNRDECATSMR